PTSPDDDPNNPCGDSRYDRLLDEDYSDEVKQALDDLQDDYRLQPLGTHSTGVITAGLPYANEDNYQVTIPPDRMPAGFDPSAFLKSWPQDMNGVPAPGPEAKTFKFINTFDKSSVPIHPGDVIHINIAAYPAAYVMMTDQQSNYYRFSTLTNVIVGPLG